MVQQLPADELSPLGPQGIVWGITCGLRIVSRPCTDDDVEPQLLVLVGVATPQHAALLESAAAMLS